MTTKHIHKWIHDIIGDKVIRKKYLAMEFDFVV